MVRRRPQQQHQGQQQPQRPHLRVGRGRAGQHGEAPGSAANDDVPVRTSLQGHGVDDRVGQRAQQHEHGGRNVHPPGGRAHRPGEHARHQRQPARAPLQGATGKGPRAGARHQAIAVGFHVLVESPRAGRGDKHRQRKHQRLPGRCPAAGNDRQPGDGGEHDERADAQLEHTEHEPPAGHGGLRHHRDGRGGRVDSVHDRLLLVGDPRHAGRGSRATISSGPTGSRGTSN